MLSRMASRAALATATHRRAWTSAFLAAVAVYALTGHWYGVVNADTIAAAWPSWSFAQRGTFRLDGLADLPSIPWFIQADGHLVSNRMAGVVLIGVPAQLLLAPLDTHPLTATTLTSVVVTAAAVANLLILLLRAGVSRAVASGAFVAVAFGTGYWSTASAELWTHGPDALWLSLCMLALQRHAYWLAGAALAPAVMTRPHLAAAAAAIGLWLTWRQRALRPALRIGVPAAGGLVLLIAWNTWTYGSPSLSGGYASYAASNATSVPVSASAWKPLLDSAAGSLLSPLRGVLVFSPFVLVAVAAVLVGWRRSPAWVQASMLGGVVYQFFQWKINAFTGGSGYFSYRLPLEMLLLAAPAAVLGYGALRVRTGPWLSRLMRAAIAVSVAIHLVGVFWYVPLRPGADQNPPAWTTWGLWQAAESRGDVGAAVAVALLVTVLVASSVWRSRTVLSAEEQVVPSPPLRLVDA